LVPGTYPVPVDGQDLPVVCLAPRSVVLAELRPVDDPVHVQALHSDFSSSCFPP